MMGAREDGRDAAQLLFDRVTRSLQLAQGARMTLVTASDIAAIAKAARAPQANVEGNWPLLVEALERENIDRPFVRAGAAATIAAETFGFECGEERGPRDYFKRYELRLDLGNTAPGDGYAYRGRGFIQITGKKNYMKYGKLLGYDLVAQPELALEASIAARIFAKYFYQERVYEYCERENWLMVRKRVNGGYGNWAKFTGVLKALLPDTIIPPLPAGVIA